MDHDQHIYTRLFLPIYIYISMQALVYYKEEEIPNPFQEHPESNNGRCNFFTLILHSACCRLP